MGGMLFVLHGILGDKEELASILLDEDDDDDDDDDDDEEEDEEEEDGDELNDDEEDTDDEDEDDGWKLRFELADNLSFLVLLFMSCSNKTFEDNVLIGLRWFSIDDVDEHDDEVDEIESYLNLDESLLLNEGSIWNWLYKTLFV